jgi:hypothetical protein
MMMRRSLSAIRPLETRLECFGHYEPDDPVCLQWCQLNIRCAIARDQYDRLDILEDLFDAVAETTRVQ